MDELKDKYYRAIDLLRAIILESTVETEFDEEIITFLRDVDEFDEVSYLE